MAPDLWDIFTGLTPLWIALGAIFAIYVLALNDGPLSGGFRGWQ